MGSLKAAVDRRRCVSLEIWEEMLVEVWIRFLLKRTGRLEEGTLISTCAQLTNIVWETTLNWPPSSLESHCVPYKWCPSGRHTTARSKPLAQVTAKEILRSASIWQKTIHWTGVTASNRQRDRPTVGSFALPGENPWKEGTFSQSWVVGLFYLAVFSEEWSSLCNPAFESCCEVCNSMAAVRGRLFTGCWLKGIVWRIALAILAWLQLWGAGSLFILHISVSFQILQGNCVTGFRRSRSMVGLPWGKERRGHNKRTNLKQQQKNRVDLLWCLPVTDPNPVPGEFRLLSTFQVARRKCDPAWKVRRRDECGQCVTHALPSEAASSGRREEGGRGDRCSVAKVLQPAIRRDTNTSHLSISPNCVQTWPTKHKNDEKKFSQVLSSMEKLHQWRHNWLRRRVNCRLSTS